MDGTNEPGGFRRAGNLGQAIANSLTISGSSGEQSPRNSVIIGEGSRGRRGANSTGRQLSAIAAGRLPSVVEAMERGDPYRTDKALVASLPPSIGSRLTTLTRTWNDPTYGYDFEVVGYQLAPGAPDDDLAVAREMVDHCLQPGSESAIKSALALLRVSTKSRAEVEDDLALGQQVFADELAKYPADVAWSAVLKLARREKFYPSLSELRDQLQREGKMRQALAKTLRAAAKS